MLYKPNELQNSTDKLYINSIHSELPNSTQTLYKLHPSELLNSTTTL